MNDNDIIQQLNNCGLIVSKLVKNGKWVSVPTYDRPNAKKGAYAVGLVAINWKIWHLNESGVIKMNNKINDSNNIQQELERIKEQDIINKQKKYRQIQNVYNLYIAQNKNKVHHQYLDKKKIELHKNVIIDKQFIIIPMYHLIENKLKISGIQVINESGSKKFLEQTQLINSFYPISSYYKDECNLFIIVEGYATGYSLYKAFMNDCKVMVLVAFSSTNLINIANMFKDYDPIVVLDNDRLVDKLKSELKCKKILGSDVYNEDANDYYIKNGNIKLKDFLLEQINGIK